MEENNKPIQTENTGVNLLLFILIIVAIFIAIFVFKSYNELIAIHELLEKNLLF